jgi:tetratricopeptide (TPR) repeat protein
VVEVQTVEMAESFNRALKFVNKNPRKSISLFKDFIKRFGENKEVWLNLSVAYKMLGDYKNCTTALMNAADEKMPFSDGKFTKLYGIALNNLGLLAHSFEREEEPEKFYLAAFEDKEHSTDNVLWNLSISKLRRLCSDDKTQDPALCWKLYDWRFKREGAEPLKNAKEGMEFWDGISSVESIVVLAEQGFGDLLMYGRYLQYLKAYAKKIWIQCDPAIRCIFEAEGYPVCYDTRETDAMVGIPMGALGKILPVIPASPPWLAHRYVPRTGGGEFRIACVWSGNPNHANDHLRSTSAFYFSKLKKYGKLYSFGPGKPEKGFEYLPVTTWDDTIEQLKKLDLVISVDTSIVHMCGSLGMPCWVLMPKMDSDFRWGLSSMGHKNVWYPSVTVIRNPNDWIKTFEHVEALLGEIIVNDK